MKGSKRIISLLLAVMLVITMIPAGIARADGEKFKLTVEKGKDISMSELIKTSDGKKLNTNELSSTGLAATFDLGTGASITGIEASVGNSAITFSSDIKSASTFRSAKVYVGANVDSRIYTITLTVSYKVGTVEQTPKTVKIALEVKDASVAEVTTNFYFSMPKNSGYLNIDHLETADADVISTSSRAALFNALGIKSDAVINSITVTSVPSQISCNKKKSDTLTSITDIGGIQVASGNAASNVYTLVIQVKYNSINTINININIFVEEDVVITVRKMTAVDLTEATMKSLFKFAGTETLSSVKFESKNNGNGVTVYYGGLPFNGTQTVSASAVKEFSVHADADASTSGKIEVLFTGIGSKGTSIDRTLKVKVTDAVASDITIKGELGESETPIPNNVIRDAAEALFGSGVTKVEFTGIKYSTNLGNFCYRIGGNANVFVEKLASGVEVKPNTEFYFSSKSNVSANDTITGTYSAVATVDGVRAAYTGNIIINYKTENKNITLPITDLDGAVHAWVMNPTFKGKAKITVSDIAAKLGTSISISDISKVVIKDTDGNEVKPVNGEFVLPAPDIANPPRYTYTAVTTTSGTYSGLLTIGTVAAKSDIASVISAIPDSKDDYKGKFSINKTDLAKTLGIIEAKLDASNLYVWASDRPSHMNYASDVNEKLFGNNFEDLKVYDCTNTTINYYYDGEAAVVSGKIILTGEDSAEARKVPAIALAVNAQTKKNVETFTVNTIANAIKTKYGVAVTVNNLTLHFNSENVTIVKGDGATVVSGSAFTVDNSSLIEFTSKNPSSDVDITYVAKTGNSGNYTGIITLKKLDQKTLDTIKTMAIYNGTKPQCAEIKVSDLKAPAGVVFNSFAVVGVTFTAKDSNNTVANAGTATYGYFSSSKTVKSNIKTFAPADTLYYIPGTTAGTAYVTYKGYANNAEYTGTIEVTVYNAANLDVVLKLASRDPYTFSTELLSADKKSKLTFTSELTGMIKSALLSENAKASYVIFTQPSNATASNNAKYGTLYTNSGLTALSTTTGYYLDKAVEKASVPASALYYIPTAASGDYSIEYVVGVEFNGNTYELGGSLKISTSPDETISADVTYYTTGVSSVYFKASDFQNFIASKNKSFNLQSIKLDAVPELGAMKYGSAVLTEDTIKAESYAASGTGKTISGLYYTPYGYDNYHVSIPFTVAYTLANETNVRTSTGTILIVVTKAGISDISYTVKSGSTVTIKANDLASVCSSATGLVLDHVYFGTTTSANLYKSTATTTANKLNASTAVYYDSQKTPNIGSVVISPLTTSGTISIPYSVYTSGGTFLYTGTIKVKVFSETTTPQFKVCKKSAQKVIFNGKQITLDAYLIDDYNYVKLRDIAYIMNGTGSQFGVEFDSKNVYCTTGSAYTPSEGDMKTGTDNSKTCVVSSFSIFVNGEYQSAYVYNIGGNNYFKLRDLGSILNFTVGWDEKQGIVIVNSSDYKA